MRYLDSISEGVREVLTSLLVCLIVLKVAGLITLSWVWVLAPFWVPALLALVMVGITIGPTWWRVQQARRKYRVRKGGN